MSLVHHTSQITPLQRVSGQKAFARWVLAFGAAVMTWDARYQSRKTLRTLSPAQLRDIGIDPMRARAEAAKPIWQK